MLFYPVEIKNAREMAELLEKIGADPRSLAYFEPKREVLKIYIHDVDFRAASFLKQELLARGGDAVLHRNIIDAKVQTSDVLILANVGVFSALLQKMKSMDCWGLKEIRENLQIFLKNYCLNNNSEPQKTKIMGILNLTPDSFHSSSRIENEKELLSRAEKMLIDGADSLDIGAESTRPGSTPVSFEEERERLIPKLKILRKKFQSAIISVDTTKPEIAKLAANEGADIINDVGNDPEMTDVAARTKLPLVVMDGDLQNLSEKIKNLRTHGIEKIIIDPGIGFGKFGSDNFKLISSIESFRIFNLPILVGHSRKRFLNIDGTAPDPEDRLPGTLAISALLAGRVDILRVHDVKENVLAVRTAERLR